MKYHENRIKCDQCEKDFNTKIKLETHFKSVHEGSDIKCNVCDKAFMTECRLKKHMKMHHQGKIRGTVTISTQTKCSHLKSIFLYW